MLVQNSDAAGGNGSSAVEYRPPTGSTGAAQAGQERSRPRQLPRGCHKRQRIEDPSSDEDDDAEASVPELDS
eukprot:58443-Pleurochrysis_carterae.AAC.1